MIKLLRRVTETEEEEEIVANMRDHANEEGVPREE